MPTKKERLALAKSNAVKDVKPSVAPVPDQDETQFKVETVVAKKRPLKKSEIFDTGFENAPSPAQVEKNRQKYKKAVSKKGAF